MVLTETIKIILTKDQKEKVELTMKEYIGMVNKLVPIMLENKTSRRLTTSTIQSVLPSAILNQCIRDARGIVKKYTERCNEALKKYGALYSRVEGSSINKKIKIPVLKKLCFYVNNQNYKIMGDIIEFPIATKWYFKRIRVHTWLTDRQKSILSNVKLGTLRITYKGEKLVAQISYEIPEPECRGGGNVMGIDLGIKCPAVSYISNGHISFHGNGRKNKYIRRHFEYLRKKCVQDKHPEAIKRFGSKEQRIMRDIDHKISKEIIETAVANDVKVIKIEQIVNIGSTTSTSRKNRKALNNWSYYRLKSYISYKARLSGIKVEFVKPNFTSQTCPKCGKRHHARDRRYSCTCGVKMHRDLIAAINICNSTEYVGDSVIRHTA